MNFLKQKKAMTKNLVVRVSEDMHEKLVDLNIDYANIVRSRLAEVIEEVEKSNKRKRVSR